ncbi:MAG TPA: hypothetical protein VFR72_04060 [Gemmatimonadales bacterium]|nr:hypothetical protein [Gemmatimonadales bacterium]
MAAERLAILAAALLLSAACRSSFLPLRGKIEVGRDPMVVFAGGQEPSSGDLYALPTAGGRAIPITFSAVAEMRPALSEDGVMVAFLRAGTLTDSMPTGVWVLNLLNGAERRIELPGEAGPPEQVGWAGRGTLVVRAGGRLYHAAAPPAAGAAMPVETEDRAAAESVLVVLLGSPPFGQAVPCANQEDLCVVGDTGAPTVFARGAREPARWGEDSIAYLEGDRLLVRPLSAGRARTVEWSGVPPRRGQLSMFPGASDEPR